MDAYRLNKVAIINGERSVTYAQMLVNIGAYAERQNFAPESRCLIFAPNSEGWIYALYAIWMQGGISVPVDASSTPGDLAYILADCQPECIWTTRPRLDVVNEALKLVPGLRPAILFIEDFNGAKSTAHPCPESVLDLTEAPERIALIIYTSGTTGSPKGVMLTYDNLMANIEGVWHDVPIFGEDRRTLMLLPVHHVLPLMGTIVAPIISGGGIAICPTLSATDIMQTLERGQVGIIIGVPRLWQTLYNGIMKKINAHCVTRALYWLCSKVQSRTLSRLVFRSVRQRMGGHISYCVCGGAALDVEIGRGLQTLGLDVLEGYGMTEAAPVIAFTRPGDYRPGCAGKALPAVECKLEDGELCARGRNIMQGYYNRPEETAQVLRNGWLHTGDLAAISPEGHITITGRTKEIIVLSNGKNVNPAELEYKLEKFTAQVKEAAVVEDNDMLCAIIVPRKEWASGLSAQEIEERLKTEVLQPYNESVETYKKVMRLFVYDGDLPRTKLDKLQRFKLKSLLEAGIHTAPKPKLVEPTFEEYKLIKQYISHEKKNLEVRPTDHLETDLGFDSLDRISLQSYLEHTFSLNITVEQLSRFRNITEMAEYVSSEKQGIEQSDIDWGKILREENSEITLPGTWPTGPWIVHSFKTLFKLHFRLASKGVRNIPPEGPFILAANHQSYLDGLCVMSYVPLHLIRRTYFFAKEQHVNTPFRRWIASRHNVVVLEQKNLAHSVGVLSSVLRQGRNLIIFPEGTRTSDGRLGDFRKMFAILSMEFNVPVVPVVINGAFEAMPRGRKWPLPKKIVVEFLPPILALPSDTYNTFSAKVRSAIESKLRIPQ